MSGEQEVRRSAGEVLIRAGIEGRLEAPPFAATLDQLYVKGWHRLGIATPELLKKRLLDQKGRTKTATLAKELLELKESASRGESAGFEAVNRLLERAEAEAAYCYSKNRLTS
jgi:hypothetical protein